MTLPPLPIDALAHQEKLLQYLEESCQKNQGWISFADFMQIALYAPGLGYYSAGMAKIGKEGDFITAPEISPLFSYCLANQCLEILKELDAPACLLELGAGNGVMAADILHFLNQAHTLPEHYFILEVSADLKARQQAYLKTHCAFFFDKIVWLDALPNTPFQGIILANEVLDAMPVHRFQIGENNSVLEEQVGKEGGHWVSRFYPTSNPLLQKVVHDLQQTLEHPLPTGYASEINLQLGPWLKSLSSCLHQGVMLFIDYGFPRSEFYHLSRDSGTLMCHTRHLAHPNPLLFIGLQDITTHVDFTALAEAGEQCGLTLAGFTHQAAFLINNNLLKIAEQSTINPMQLSQQIQKLSQPHEMGELFKVMALTKDFTEELQGFSLFDQQHRL